MAHGLRRDSWTWQGGRNPSSSTASCHQPTEESTTKHRIASFAQAASCFGAAAAGTVSGGAAQSNPGAAVVQDSADDGLVNVEVVDSFNNLSVLNSVPRNSPDLSTNDVDVPSRAAT